MLLVALFLGTAIPGPAQPTNDRTEDQSAAAPATDTANAERDGPQSETPPPVPAEEPQADSVPPPTQGAGAPTPTPLPEGTTPTETTAAPGAAENGGNGLRLNFRGARLDQVLDYLSDAAGFVINKEADVKGTVDVWSKEPVSKEEAVDLLNSVLKKNGYAVIRNGRILTIISRDEAKTADLEVTSGSDPNEVDKSDEVITRIIPVRYANVTQLLANLQPLLPMSATLTANESANTLILVATKTDIKRMLKIVTALDTSIATVSTIKVFPLEYADAKDLATVIQQLFGTQTSAQGAAAVNPRAQLFNMFVGGRGGGGTAGNARGGGTGGGGGGAAAVRVVAVGDDRTNSLIVSAPAELMATITDMVAKIDQPVSDVTELRVFHLMNADPVELADQFAQLFPDETRTGSSQGTGGFMFGGRGGFARGTAAASQASTSERARKMGRVLAVPDQRTSSIIVSAASTLMPQIAAMIAQLDASPAKRERVAIYELQNADPLDVHQVLQDLFNRNTYMRSSSTRNNQQNALTTRQNQQQTTSGVRSVGSGTSRSVGSSSGLGATGF
jgi:general secretion pathway protein D